MQERILIRRKDLVWLSCSPRSRGPNCFWGFVLRQLQDSEKRKHNIPKKTQISFKYECNSESLSPGGTCNHSVGFPSVSRVFSSLWQSCDFWKLVVFTLQFRSWLQSLNLTVATNQSLRHDCQRLSGSHDRGFWFAGVTEREKFTFFGFLRYRAAVTHTQYSR